MFEKYEVGTVVKIAKSSEYYREGDSSNPKDIVGTITENNLGGDDNHLYWVHWSNEKGNDYKHEDLELVEAKKLTNESTDSYV